ncbi:heptaprenyl diphosphate synthase component 1 [Oceanobacillus jeddahense]|uniref:Heptaprenyl diphosphate synthase component 1 n=1 Tax=Oceanobacillus jeddahense TaxID=1462527 RepID=A0ABY5JL05_9BACI|nr:heptaprenyl diphosphate synthase component 1 [Oceanobacillus jeddahense]UUI00963.1 heptaprenyl diphosphate synthase component 1 [Oceanobacillus jeddahense]
MLTTFITTDKGYRKILENKLYDSYIHKHIRYPVIDEEKWNLLLFLVEQHKTLTSLQREKYIISTMLVQIALDTHDFVPVKQKAGTENEMIEKQLQVLSGDYYSGLYYLLLAEAGEIQFIQTLANAIREINELKVTLYYEEQLPLETWLNIKMKLNASLLVHVAKYLHGAELESIIQNWLMYRRLDTEEATYGYSLLRMEWEARNNKATSMPLIDEKLLRDYEKAVYRAISQLSNSSLSMEQFIYSQETNELRTSRL